MRRDRYYLQSARVFSGGGIFTRGEVQANLMGDIDKLLPGDLFESFAFMFQLFVEFYRLLLHEGVSILRPPIEAEILAPGNPAVSVFIIEPEAEQIRFLIRVFHFGVTSASHPRIKASIVNNTNPSTNECQAGEVPVEGADVK